MLGLKEGYLGKPRFLNAFQNGLSAFFKGDSKTEIRSEAIRLANAPPCRSGPVVKKIPKVTNNF